MMDLRSNMRVVYYEKKSRKLIEWKKEQEHTSMVRSDGIRNQTVNRVQVHDLE